MSRPALIARDPRTLRRVTFAMAAGWDHNSDPEVLSRYLIQQIEAIGRGWNRRYGVPFPLARIEWSVRWIEHPAQLGGGA